jgi:NAD(P)-dependent dehydrogenase (short-subunit alcohol dehydrogenase family)
MSLLEGEVALVTGAADGIGLAIARRYAAEGASVALADVRAEAAEDAAAALRDAGHDAIALAMDVGDEDSTDAAVRACAEQLGGLDIAVANAGIIHLAPAMELELAQFRRVLDVNLVGAFLTCRAAARQMVQSGTAGRLVVTSSLFGVRGGRGNAAYSASKFGAIGMAQCLAADLAKHNILVNAVCPGPDRHAAPAQDGRREGRADRGERGGARGPRDGGGHPAGAPGRPRRGLGRLRVPRLAAGRYVTGQSLVVDGGMTVG